MTQVLSGEVRGLPKGFIATPFFNPETFARIKADFAEALGSCLFRNQGPHRVIGVLPEGVFAVTDGLRNIPEHLRPLRLAFDFVKMRNHSVGDRASVLDPRGEYGLDCKDQDTVLLHSRMCSGSTAVYLQRRAEAEGARSVHHVAMLAEPRARARLGSDLTVIHELPEDVPLIGYGLDDVYTETPQLAYLSNIYEVSRA